VSQPVEFRECLVGCFCAPTGSPFQVGAILPLHLAGIFFESSLRVFSIFFSKLLTWRSSEHMVSMVVFIRLIRRLRSKLLKPRLRMISEIRTISRPSLHRQRHHGRPCRQTDAAIKNAQRISGSSMETDSTLYLDLGQGGLAKRMRKR